MQSYFELFFEAQMMTNGEDFSLRRAVPCSVGQNLSTPCNRATPPLIGSAYSYKGRITWSLGLKDRCSAFFSVIDFRDVVTDAMFVFEKMEFL